jgi:sorbitol/mannitol transport system substrate-binding protein
VLKIIASAVVALLLPFSALAGEVTVATVNNPDMVIMQQLAPVFMKANPGITVKFVVLPDQVMRQTVTQDAAVGGGRFDVATISPYEVQSSWADNKWLEPLDPRFAGLLVSQRESYDLDDIIPTIRQALTYKDGKLYALPFNGESSFTMYRKDLLAKKGLTLPPQPTWTEIRDVACKANDPSNGVYGILMKGVPEYGQLAPFITLMHAFGAKWFDQNWQPQITSEKFRKAFHFYVSLVKDCGEPGASSVGVNEELTLFAQGRGAIWVDATTVAGFVEDPKQSKVVGKVGYLPAPIEVTKNGSAWLYTWGLGILSSSKHKDDAFKFVLWATSKDYINLVAQQIGAVRIPSGTRISTYRRPDYLKVAPFAEQTLKSIEVADMKHPAADPVPYTGTAQVNMAEYASWAAEFGRNFSAVIAGRMTEDAALTESQKTAERAMREAGYLKN